jgi:hypothetical protein
MRKEKNTLSEEDTLKGLAGEETTDADRLRRLVDYVREDFRIADEEGRFRAFLHGLAPHVRKTDYLKEQDAAALHREFGEMFRGLVADPPQRYPLPTAYGFLRRQKPGATIRFSGEGRTVDNIRWGVVNLLLSAGENLLACKECGEPFVRERRQVFCSERCSQRVRDRRRGKGKPLKNR